MTTKRRLLVEHCHQCIWSNGYVCFHEEAKWKDVRNNNCVPRDGMYQKGIPDWCPLPVDDEEEEA